MIDDRDLTCFFTRIVVRCEIWGRHPAVEGGANVAARLFKVVRTVDGQTLEPTLWFDVEDLLHYVAAHRRPSGIQRLSFQIYQALKNSVWSSYSIGFVRHAPNSQFRVVDWAQVDMLFDEVEETAAIVDTASPTGNSSNVGADNQNRNSTLLDADNVETTPVSASQAPDSIAPPSSLDGLRRLSRRLPDRYRRPALQFAAMQFQAGVALAYVGGTTARAAAIRLRYLLKPEVVDKPQPEEPIVVKDILLGNVARRGDVLASIGSPWFDDDYAARLSHVRSRLGMRIAVLVYDMIPVKRPEWCRRGTVRVFQHYYSTVLPLADTVFTISHNTAQDLMIWCREKGVALAPLPIVIPIGSGFKTTNVPTVDFGRATKALGLSRRYVLFVSTIEIRKNHILLFRVWRRLLEMMPRDAVPELVFAGAEGWLVRDLMQQITNSRSLDGKLRIVHNARDTDLVALYKGCMFTVFPSFYEGWGLPVTEALGFGKPCIAAGVSSIPEAGGNLVRYFDPGNLDDAVETIRAVIEDEADLADWTRRIQDKFRPVSWTESAQAIVAALQGVAAS